MDLTIWLLIEEPETGSFADGSTHCVLSAHRTESGAEEARDAWRESHQGASDHAHRFEPADVEDGWCVCGAGVSLAETTLED